MKQMEQKALCADLVHVKMKQWVLEQVSTLHFMVCDAWKLSSKPLGLVDQPLLVYKVVQGQMEPEREIETWLAFICLC